VHDAHAKHVPTIEEAKADIERQIGLKLGRPLSDAEVQMIDVSKSGEQISITLHQPLTGRLMKAIHDAKAATQPTAMNPPAAVNPPDGGGDPTTPPAMNVPHLADGATTLPGSLPATIP
jgi:hypothetical protein